MSHLARFSLRLVIYSFYIILATGTATLLISDISRLFWAGILLFLFLISRVFHLGDGERSIIELFRYLPRLSRREAAQKGEKFEKKFNAADYLTSGSFSILERAYDKALVVGGDVYLYLIKFLVQLPDIKKGLARLDVEARDFELKIDELIKGEENKNIKNSKEELFLKIEALAKLAFLDAVGAKNKFVEPVNFFSALGGANDVNINKLFNLFDINSADLGKAMLFSRFDGGFSFWRNLPKVFGGFAAKPYRIRHRVINRAWTSRTTPILDKFGADFTDLARAGEAGFIIGHEEEYNRLVDILSRPTKPNVLLLGEPGSGRETLISALAFAIIKDEVPAAIFDKRLVSLQISNLVSGASQEELSKRLNKIVEEIIMAGNIILYIPDIHNLTKPFENSGMSAADILMPIINNDTFPVVASTYLKEYKQFIEPLSDFANAFEVVRVEEVSEDEAIKILIYKSLILERQHRAVISFNAVKKSVELAHRYFRQKLLPSSAEDLLKEALSYILQNKDRVLNVDDVIAVVERKINVPIKRASKEEAEKLLNLENIIHQSLIDQEPAVSAVSRALREYRSGLSRKGGPIAAFLFVGPTGVGKTELSKILAKIQFGSENAMVRFDMSEYQTKESIMRFIGAPDGKNSGSLTEAIIQKPFSLVLFDEFEKAHPDILNLFLQVFDDGRLTDNLGRTVDFTNTIIIATSNAHSNFIKEQIEAGAQIGQVSEDLKKKLTEYFKPELLNRFSQVVVFKNLSREDTEAIARLQLKSLAKTLGETHSINLAFDELAIKRIAELGYDPVFGARPLRQVISEKLRGVLAEKILKEEIVKGGRARVILENDEIKISVG